MEWVIAGVLLAAGAIGGVLLVFGIRDPLTKRYTPRIFGHPGNAFESNLRDRDEKSSSANSMLDKPSGSNSSERLPNPRSG